MSIYANFFETSLLETRQRICLIAEWPFSHRSNYSTSATAFHAHSTSFHDITKRKDSVCCTKVERWMKPLLRCEIHKGVCERTAAPSKFLYDKILAGHEIDFSLLEAEISPFSLLVSLVMKIAMIYFPSFKLESILNVFLTRFQLKVTIIIVVKLLVFLYFSPVVRSLLFLLCL